MEGKKGVRLSRVGSLWARLARVAGRVGSGCVESGPGGAGRGVGHQCDWPTSTSPHPSTIGTIIDLLISNKHWIIWTNVAKLVAPS